MPAVQQRKEKTMDSPQVFEAHDSALQELHTLRVATCKPAVEPMTQSEKDEALVAMAELISVLCDQGKVKSVRRIAMARRVLTDPSLRAFKTHAFEAAELVLEAA